MRCVIFFSFLIACGCNNNVKPKHNNVGGESKFNLVQNIDKLTWLFYSFNYNGNVYFYDSLTDKRIEVRPVECNVVLIDFFKNKDYNIYKFVFQKENCQFLYSDNNIEGFRVYNNIAIPILNHAHFTFENNIDSMINMATKIEASFCDYLKNYKGNLSTWLLIESRKRKCM